MNILPRLGIKRVMTQIEQRCSKWIAGLERITVSPEITGWLRIL